MNNFRSHYRITGGYLAMRPTGAPSKFLPSSKTSFNFDVINEKAIKYYEG